MLKRIAPYIRYLRRVTEGFHGKVALRIVLGVIRVGAVLAFIWLSKTAIDCATGRVPVASSTLIALFALMVACLLADLGLSQWVRYIEARTLMLMNNRVNRRLFNTLMVLPLVNGQQGFHSGDMLNRLTLDVRTVSSFAVSQLPSMIVLLVQLASAFLFLAWLNPFLALAPVIIMPVCILASKMYFRRHRRLTAEIRRGESDMHVSIQEGLKHRLVLRSLEGIGEMDRRIASIQKRLNAANRQQTRLSVINGALVRFGFVTGYLIAFGWSIFSLKAGIITFGTMSAFLQLVNRIQNPIAGLAGYLPSFVTTSVAIDRLMEIDVALPSDDDKESRLLFQNAGVSIRSLSFRYESDGEDVISGFSHDFTPGSRTMIIGPTGVGKTTLIKLLLGILSPNEGSVEIYGGNGSCRVSSSTLCNFVYVPQGNSLLPGTIRDNLLLAAPDATDSRLADALHTACADFVFSLPLGLDTSCDEAGGGLSEGQAQRIAIARALLRPGSIMLLDEFNSALDADTAATIMQRLAESHPTSTIIIIAHHRSAITPYCHTILSLQ